MVTPVVGALYVEYIALCIYVGKVLHKTCCPQDGLARVTLSLQVSVSGGQLIPWSLVGWVNLLFPELRVIVEKNRRPFPFCGLPPVEVQGSKPFA